MSRNQQAAIGIRQIEATLAQMRSDGVTDQNLTLLHQQALELQQIAREPATVTTSEFYARMRSALTGPGGMSGML